LRMSLHCNGCLGRSSDGDSWSVTGKKRMKRCVFSTAAPWNHVDATFEHMSFHWALLSACEDRLNSQLRQMEYLFLNSALRHGYTSVGMC
jgi:hypothetical protein